MRVISGKNRGTKLLAPEGDTTRPTTDRIKETLFNMIGFDIPGCRFLDLFSGSGAIGIEALSRGAKQAVFVEQNTKAIQCITSNLDKTRLTDQATVYPTDVMQAVDKLAAQGEQFDIIFLDPPYALPTIREILELIATKGLLSDTGYLILEQASDKTLGEVEGLTLIKEKHYKTTTMSFYEGMDNK